MGYIAEHELSRCGIEICSDCLILTGIGPLQRRGRDSLHSVWRVTTNSIRYRCTRNPRNVGSEFFNIRVAVACTHMEKNWGGEAVVYSRHLTIRDLVGVLLDAGGSLFG